MFFMKRIKYLIVVSLCLVVVLFIGCASISVGFPETKKDIETASQMEDYIPLTVKKLKKIILEDTTHYKFVIFYGTNCGPCVKNMIEVYPKILNKVGDTEVKWYYIMESTAGIKGNDKLLKRVGLENITKYYLQDDDKRFNTKNFNNLNNIANYIFDTKIEVNDNWGIPTSFIVSKDNKVKLSYYIYKGNKVRIHTTDMYDILNKSLEQIDFDKMDTTYLDYEPLIYK